MKKILVLFFMSVLLNSCNFNANASYENEKVEKEKAESVIGLLYLYTSMNSFDEVIHLFSDSFFKVSSKEKLKQFLEEKKQTLGDFKDYSLVNWKTNRVTGTNPKTEYLMVYEVKYTNYNATETISLVKENQEIKIIGYNVNKK
jgi:hypothetical protein